MNILFFVSNLSYPPTEGAHARTLELIKTLALRGHAVTISGFIKSNSPFDIALFHENNKNISITGLKKYSGNYISQALRNIFSKANFPPTDIAHFEGFAVISCGARCKAPKILSLIDPWALRQRRKSQTEKNTLKKIVFLVAAKISESLEKKYLKTYSSVHVVSPIDAIALEKSQNLNTVVHIPVSFDQHQMAPQKTDYTTTGKFKIVFWADVNVEYLLESLKWYISKIHEEISNNIDLELYILGRTSKKNVFNKIPSLREFSNLTIVEWTEDLNSFLSSMDMAVLPDLNGTGLKNRTLHTISLGLPTIGSKFAFEGISINSFSSTAICHNTQDYINNITKLSSSAEFRESLASQLKKDIADNYDATVIAAKWENLYLATKAKEER